MIGVVFQGLAKAGPKVLVPIGVGLAGGVAAATKGTVDLVQGRKARKEAGAEFDEALARCETVRTETEAAAAKYGELQLDVYESTIERFAAWLERNQTQVRRLGLRRVDGVRVKPPRVPRYVSDVSNVSVGLAGVVQAVGAGASAQAGALWGVSQFASASTGTAISSLSGVAAQNATLAFLGGGPVAAGGGGVAAGSAVLGAITVVPAVIVGGATLGVVGAKVKKRSRLHAAEVRVAAERLDALAQTLAAANRRFSELEEVLNALRVRAESALDVLDGVEFEAKKHAREFLKAYQLITAVREVLDTPVFDDASGLLTPESAKLKEKYL